MFRSRYMDSMYLNYFYFFRFPCTPFPPSLDFFPVCKWSVCVSCCVLFVYQDSRKVSVGVLLNPASQLHLHPPMGCLPSTEWRIFQKFCLPDPFLLASPYRGPESGLIWDPRLGALATSFLSSPSSHTVCGPWRCSVEHRICSQLWAFMVCLFLLHSPWNSGEFPSVSLIVFICKLGVVNYPLKGLLL